MQFAARSYLVFCIIALFSSHLSTLFDILYILCIRSVRIFSQCSLVQQNVLFVPSWRARLESLLPLPSSLLPKLPTSLFPSKHQQTVALGSAKTRRVFSSPPRSKMISSSFIQSSPPIPSQLARCSPASGLQRQNERRRPQRPWH